MSGLTVRKVTTRVGRRDAGRVRYQVYCAERGMFRDRANHTTGELLDPIDDSAHIWVAYVGGEPVGTIRVVWGAECSVDEALESNFSASRFNEVVGPRRIIAFGRFMILPEHRSSLVSALLLNEVTSFSFERAIDVGFCDCEPTLVPYYYGMGFRPYRGTYNDPEMGLKVPMVLLAADRSHMREVGSFVAPLVPDTIRAEPEPQLLDLVSDPTGACAAMGSSLDRARRTRLERAAERCALFDSVPPGLVQDLIDASVLVTFRRGDDLVKQRHASQCLWWLVEGEASVVADGRFIRTACAGDAMGELAALRGSRRPATVSASTDGEALVVPHQVLMDTLHDLTATRTQLAANLARLSAKECDSVTAG